MVVKCFQNGKALQFGLISRPFSQHSADCMEQFSHVAARFLYDEICRTYLKTRKKISGFICKWKRIIWVYLGKTMKLLILKSWNWTVPISRGSCELVPGYQQSKKWHPVIAKVFSVGSVNYWGWILIILGDVGVLNVDVDEQLCVTIESIMNLIMRLYMYMKLFYCLLNAHILMFENFYKM